MLCIILIVMKYSPSLKVIYTNKHLQSRQEGGAYWWLVMAITRLRQQQLLQFEKIYLPYLPLVPHICVGELGHNWFRQWLVVWAAPSHYPNQCWDIINLTLMSKLKLNFNRNSNISIEKNTFEKVVCKMLSISSRPLCIKCIETSCVNC